VISTLRALLIVTFRPEFAQSWIGHPHVTNLTINRLEEREIGAMIDHVAGDNSTMPGRSAKPLHLCRRCALPASLTFSVGNVRQQQQTPIKLSLWRRRRSPPSGRDLEQGLDFGRDGAVLARSRNNDLWN